MAAIGRSLPRKEGRRKVTGQARYVDDLTLPGMLHGTTVRSASPRGTIRSIDFQPGVPWDEFTDRHCRRHPGRQRRRADHRRSALPRRTDRQSPGRARRSPRPSRSPSAREGAQARPVVVDPLPPVFTIDESLARTATIWRSDNIFKSYLVSRGDVDAGVRRGCAHRRGHLRDRSPGAALHRAERHARGRRS